MRLPPITAKGFALACVGVLCLTTSGVLVNTCHNARLLINSAKGTTDNAAAATGKVNTYLTPDVLRDFHNDVTASVGTGQITANAYAEVARSSTSLLDRHAAPLLDAMRLKFADTMEVLTRRGDENLALLADNQRRLGGTINSATALLDGLAATASRFGVTVEELNEAVKMASDKTGRSLDALYALMSSPEWTETLKHLDGSAANVETVTANVAAASAQAPSIAKSLEKISRESSRFARVTLIANVLSTLARAFLP